MFRMGPKSKMEVLEWRRNSGSGRYDNSGKTRERMT